MSGKDERINYRILSIKRNNRIAAAVAAVFIICSVVIIAVKYRSSFTDTFDEMTNSQAMTGYFATANDALGKQAEAVSRLTEEPASEEVPEETTTEEATTEEVTTEEATTEAPVDISEYVNTENPDLSSKGDDWYDEERFVPGNVTDNKYFDTALLIGDSRTEGLALYTGVSNLDAFYSKGLTIEKVMTEPVVELDDGSLVTVLEALTSRHYDSIYISFGINELGWAYDYMFIDYYKEFIDAIREVEEDAVIYVENILPVSAELSATDEIFTNERVNSFNDLLKEMCMDYGDVIYLDVASSVKVDGVLPEDASTDGIHCNKDYCLKWLDYIKNNVYIPVEQ